jgi:hypothetical protein
MGKLAESITRPVRLARDCAGRGESKAAVWIKQRTPRKRHPFALLLLMQIVFGRMCSRATALSLCLPAISLLPTSKTSGVRFYTKEESQTERSSIEADLRGASPKDHRGDLCFVKCRCSYPFFNGLKTEYTILRTNSVLYSTGPLEGPNSSGLSSASVRWHSPWWGT